MSKTALITGITGQDGSYLSELLLSKGYKVHGIVRRVALEDETHRLWRIRKILKDITLHSGSLESYATIFNIILKIKPDEIYHLGSQSYVGYSFEDEFSTFNMNINGTHYMLSAAREIINSNVRFYFAASSELISTQFSPQTSIRRGLFWVTILQCMENLECVTCKGKSPSGITLLWTNSGYGLCPAFS